MRKRLFFQVGIAVETLILFLIFGIWRGNQADGVTDQTTAVSVGAESVIWNENENSEGNREEAARGKKNDFIKWAEFNVSYEALNRAYTYDVETYKEDVHLNWVELLAYLGAEYGGDFTKYKEKDMAEAADKLLSGDITIEELTTDMKYYEYYKEAYGAVLNGMVGEYKIEQAPEEASGGKQTSGEEKTLGEKPEEKIWKKYYGLKAFSPIAKTFPYSEYDDFGISRSYGYRRNHLGHDMMGQVGTPIIAVESGYVRVMGWNQYGGWRIGISSFDERRYYYYAHLRQNLPFAQALKEGAIVQAGDVIGYMGRTGYSTKENVNNIDTSHLHFGLQLIFDESQREGSHEIWVDVYPLVKFLSQNRSEVLRNDADKSWYRKYEIKDPAAEGKRGCVQ